MAFITQVLGTGVLQASLTIFGAVGGPLLALFTMGMLCKSANQKVKWKIYSSVFFVFLSCSMSF